MQPESIQEPIAIESFNPVYFAYEKQALGLATTLQNIYLFFSDKIRVFQQLTSVLTPELIEEIHVANRKIKLFCVNEDFIAVLFEDNGLEIRQRQHWEKVQYTAALSKDVKVRGLKFSQSKLIYSFNEHSVNKYGFIDIHENQKPKIWDNATEIQQLLHKSNLNGMTDFYLILSDNQVKYGLLYSDEQQIKPYEIGHLPEFSTPILDIGILQTITNKPLDAESMLPKLVNKKISLLQLVDCRQNSEKKIVKLICRKLHEYDDNKPPPKMADKAEKLYNHYEEIHRSLEQIEKNTGLISNAQIESEVELQVEKCQTFEKMVISKEKSTVFISFTDCIFEILLNSKILKVSKIYKKNKVDKLCEIGNSFTVFESKAWTLASFENQIQKVENHQKNPTKKVQKKPKMIDRELQTDTLDQFDEKYMNQIIDKLFQKKKVCDCEVQTHIEVPLKLLKTQKKEEISIPTKILTDAETQTQHKEEDLEQVKEKDKNEDENEREILISREIIHHHHETIQYFPSQKHTEQILKLSDNLRQLECDVEYKCSTKITDLLKNQHQKLKESCMQTLRKICEQQIASKIIPIIEEKLSLIFEHKLQQMNQYIYSLSIENLYSLRDEYEKDRVNQRMLQNQLMKKQIFEVEQCKKAVTKILQINKVREIQKLVFFQQIKNKFVEIEAKVDKLQQNIQETVAQETDNQSKFIEQIDIIKGLLKFKHEKKEDSVCSDQNSSRKSQYSDKDQISEESESQEQDSEESQSEEQQEIGRSKPYSGPMLPPMPYYPPPQPQFYNRPPPMNYYPHEPIYPPNFPGHMSYHNPYQQPYQLSRQGYSATQGSYPFFTPMIEQQQSLQTHEKRNQKKKKNRNK